MIDDVRVVGRTTYVSVPTTPSVFYSEAYYSTLLRCKVIGGEDITVDRTVVYYR